MTKEVTYNLTEFTGGLINRNTPRSEKMEVLSEMINPSRYTVLGFDKNGSVLRLQPRFHNVRDSKGRFKATRRSR